LTHGYWVGKPASGTSRERFERMLADAEYLANHIHEARRRKPYPHVGPFDLPSGKEHAAGSARARPWRDSDDALYLQFE